MDQRDKELIRKERLFLVKNLVVDEAFIAKSIELRIYTDEMAQVIMAERIDMSKASRYLDLLVKRGPKAFSKFIEALHSTSQDCIVDRLMPGQGGAFRRSDWWDDVEGSSGDHAGAALHPSRSTEIALPERERRQLPKSSKEWLHSGPDSLPDVRKMLIIDEVKRKIQGNFAYDMDVGGKGINGRVICIHYEDVHGQEYREGNEHDVKALKKLFGSPLLRFDFVEITSNEACCKEDLFSVLRKEANRDDLKNIRVLFVFVMSHGSRDVFLTTLGDEVSIDELTAEFDSKNCPLLEGKPKSFFIQACQGDQVKTDSKVEPRPTAAQIREAEIKGQMHKADIKKYVCTYPGSLGGRLASYGTFFIQAICHVFASFVEEMNVSDMMGQVTTVVNEHNYAFRMVPYEFGNQKMLYLCPGY